MANQGIQIGGRAITHQSSNGHLTFGDRLDPAGQKDHEGKSMPKYPLEDSAGLVVSRNDTGHPNKNTITV